MQNIIDMIDINNDLYHFLSNSFLNSKKKWLFLYIIYHIENISSNIIRLIQLNTEKKKYSITCALIKLWAKKKKWVKIYVITAIPISNSIELYLLKFFQKSNNNKFYLKKKVNNRIIGGLILRLKDKEWDNSLEERIRKLKIHFKYHI